MKILVTGCGGFIGSNLLKALMKLNYNVHGVDSFDFGFKKNLIGISNWEKKSFVNLSEEEVNKYDILIHLATANLIYAQEHTIETFKLNAINTIDFFSKFHGKIIYTSTASIYGNPEEIPTSERSPFDCYNSYDTSKYVAELFLRYRRNYTCLRLNNTYGVNQWGDERWSGVVGRMIHKALNSEPIEIIGDGKQTRSFTYVDDVVNAIVLSIEQEAKNQSINIGSDKEVNMWDLVDMIEKEMDIKLGVKQIPSRSIDRITRRCLNIERAKYTLGWIPKTSLEEGIKRTIEWQRSLK